MRKITLTLLALVVFAAAYCGVPQAINYQAIVQNSSGSPIKNKDISMRLSILSGSATGTVAYQETQTAATDGIGVTSVNIGNGTVVSGSFAGINWSTGTYFLKTEIDTNGGTNYATVGTVQFFSVPFSQYAATAAQANLGSLDYPDGVNSIVPKSLNGSFSYTVPAGQTFYVTELTNNGSSICPNYGISINGVYIASSESGSTLGAASTSSTATANSRQHVNLPFALPSGYVLNSTSCGTSVIGFTMPSNYQWVVFDLSSGNYTVPSGKVLVIKNLLPSTSATWGGYYNINGITTGFAGNLHFIDQGSTVSSSGLTGSLLMIGYLKNR